MYALLAAWPAIVLAFAPPVQPTVSSLNERIANILPKPDEERWLSVGWRTNVMAARAEAQKAHKPLFLWVMVGNPQGCT